jgi:hypothetical protein
MRSRSASRTRLHDGGLCSRGTRSPGRVEGGLISGIRDHDKNVYDGLGGQIGDGRRTDMLDAQGGAAKRVGDETSVLLKLLWPICVIVGNLISRFSTPPISPVSTGSPAITVF